MTSDARAPLRAGDDAETEGVADPRDQTAAGAPPGEAAVPDDDTRDEAAGTDAQGDDEFAEAAAPDDEAGDKADDKADDKFDDKFGDRADEHAAGGDDGDRRRRGGTRPSLPLVPVLAVLFALLLAATAFLWFTRPSPSSVRSADYAQVLEAARSGVVDLTSFDYLTLDDDIAQIKKIATGDLRTESVDQLNKNRQTLTDQQAVVNTQVVGAAVTRADSSNGTVLLVIQSTQKTKAATQPTVTRFRIQVDLDKQGGRWLLSGIKGR